MNKENGITLVTVIIMVIVIGIISTTSILTTRKILQDSKEEAKKQNLATVETAVSRYAAQVATSGVFSPANITLPGTKDPILEHVYMNDEGIQVTENKNVGEDWYLLLETDLEKIGVTYAEENYLVNYKKNVVIPLSSSDDVFDLVNYYENNQK